MSFTVCIYCTQTGSGKTYTMGTNYNGECTNGIIPKVMKTIFKRVEETKGNTEYLIRVSFIEVIKSLIPFECSNLSVN